MFNSDCTADPLITKSNQRFNNQSKEESVSNKLCALLINFLLSMCMAVSFKNWMYALVNSWLTAIPKPSTRNFFKIFLSLTTVIIYFQIPRVRWQISIFPEWKLQIDSQAFHKSGKRKRLAFALTEPMTSTAGWLGIKKSPHQSWSPAALAVNEHVCLQYQETLRVTSAHLSSAPPSFGCCDSLAAMGASISAQALILGDFTFDPQSLITDLSSGEPLMRASDEPRRCSDWSCWQVVRVVHLLPPN